MAVILNDMEDIIVNKFTEETAIKFRSQVQKRSALDPNMPIVVYIDSYGGQVDALNSMISTLESVPNTIITVCLGKAMSCGAVLLSAGDVRFVDKHARVMIHEVSGGAFGSVDDVKNDVEEMHRLNIQLMTFIAKRCKLSYKELKQKIKDNEGREVYLTADQAKAIGIVEYVGLPVIRSTVMFSVDVIEDKKYGIMVDEAPLKKKVVKKVVKKKSKK